MLDPQLDKVAEAVAAKVMETLRSELSYGRWLTIKEAMAHAKVHAIFAEKAKEESERRAAERKKIQTALEVQRMAQNGE
jgi:hypothetical protein